MPPALLQGEPERGRATFDKVKHTAKSSVRQMSHRLAPCGSARADLRKQGEIKYKRVSRMLGQNTLRHHDAPLAGRISCKLPSQGHRMNKFAACLALLLCCALCACDSSRSDKPSTPLLGIVDMERVMRESAPAKAARKHLEDVRDVLQKGMKALEEEWKDAPEAERSKTIAEGLSALNRQMAAEENAANRLVATLLQEECERWRATHKAVAVVSKQRLLAADAGADVTTDIVSAMNARTLDFPALPTVQIKKRGEASLGAEQQSAEEQKAKTDKRPATAGQQ